MAQLFRADVLMSSLNPQDGVAIESWYFPYTNPSAASIKMINMGFKRSEFMGKNSRVRYVRGEVVNVGADGIPHRAITLKPEDNTGIGWDGKGGGLDAAYAWCAGHSAGVRVRYGYSDGSGSFAALALPPIGATYDGFPTVLGVPRAPLDLAPFAQKASEYADFLTVNGARHLVRKTKNDGLVTYAISGVVPGTATTQARTLFQGNQTAVFLPDSQWRIQGRRARKGYGQRAIRELNGARTVQDATYDAGTNTTSVGWTCTKALEVDLCRSAGYAIPRQQKERILTSLDVTPLYKAHRGHKRNLL